MKQKKKIGARKDDCYLKIQISRSIIEYEIQMEQLAQLCGVDFEKVRYIIQSLYKYFSGGKYASYEEQMQDNIRIEGRKVGRKYFLFFMLLHAKV